MESGFYNHRVDVKLNLAVALMRRGNQAASPAAYRPLYAEAAAALRAALRAHPGHWLAQSTLDAVGRNCRLRAQADGPESEVGGNECDELKAEDVDTDEDIRVRATRAALEPVLGGGAAAGAEALRRAAEYGRWLRKEMRESAARRAAHRALAPGLSYIDALHHALAGAVDDGVLAAMRWERTDVDLAGRPSKLVSFAQELGEMLLGLGDAAAAHDGLPGLAAEAYREGAEGFESVLLHQPHNAVAARRLNEARERLMRYTEYHKN